MAPEKRRGFGSLRQLRSKRWQARYHDQFGEEHTAPSTFASRPEGARWLAAVQTDMERGQWVDHRLGRITVAAWADEYLAGSVHKRATTQARDRSAMECHIIPALGRKPLA